MRNPVYALGRPPGRPGSKTGLTLLELLGVVVILALVWGFVFPATQAVREASRRRHAAVEAQSLASAVLLYRDTYGRWPLQGHADEATDIVYAGTNTTSGSSVTRLDQSELIRALIPTAGDNPENPRQLLFLDAEANRIVDGYFVDPWSTTNNPSAYVVAVDANGDGWIGARDGSPTVYPLEIESGGKTHWIPAVQEPVYVFSWTDMEDATNRVSTVRQP